jgi:hypothetical protein
MGGGGKSSGSSSNQVQLTPEQKQALQVQTDFLKNTALPAYTNTIGGAKDVLGQVMPNVQKADTNASNVASNVGNLSGAVGAGSLLTGVQGLSSLFDPNYEKNQVNAALQSGREATREQLAGQNAMYGGAGGLGSSRQALADVNLQQLGEQRQATAAAGAQAQVQANKAAAANQLAQIGGAGSQIGYAGAPQDVYNKYASVVFGVPQANTTPNFGGTQSSTGTSSGKGLGFKI